jgi:hypothetical protein
MTRLRLLALLTLGLSTPLTVAAPQPTPPAAVSAPAQPADRIVTNART